ncbi:fumarylacetoacetate hydrolase family protein [Halomicroarcula sp. F13]|uniref:Fumarylacetoacetate hydrolase family protein n=1 Tax=Haloarcula rubra TaxID=2487747 RepID=A0AAW4PQ02_9EURY|nr:fumarylacetoacetate hydrolase family protein [Halomicroarcula rubra]MBX0323192.1 fumarylacetoacetate hydrolase family protein [Halomicroarcula rubra]
MRYYRTVAGGEPRLVARDGDDAYDLTAARSSVTAFTDLAHVADVAGESPDAVARGLFEDAVAVDRPDAADCAAPRVDEVWAAGVTYEISEQAREAESGMPEMYLDVYEAERPEIFFKATPSRTVGPDEAVGIRGDSEWDVPEPELGIVLHEGDIVGYTVGNDVSSRSIEGENPLYLPQAKIYDRACSLGPCVATPAAVGDPHDLEMTMTVDRDDERVYQGVTSTGEMVRTCEELVSFLTRHNRIPETTVLLTGTSLVPEEGFTLQQGDRIDVHIESIGRLSNSVTVV